MISCTDLQRPQAQGKDTLKGAMKQPSAIIYNPEALVIVGSVALSFSSTNMLDCPKSLRQSQLCCLEHLNPSSKDVITYSPSMYRQRSNSYNCSYCSITFGSNYFISRMLIQHIGQDNRDVKTNTSGIIIWILTHTKSNQTFCSFILFTMNDIAQLLLFVWFWSHDQILKSGSRQ